MKNREQEPGLSDRETDRIEHLLRSAFPAVGDRTEPQRDLWPVMLRRMDEQASRGAASVPWFDWALGGALLALAAAAPHTIPVILYYL